jgi:hypothetical protein
VFGFDFQFLLAGLTDPVVLSIDKRVVVDAFAVVIRTDITFHAPVILPRIRYLFSVDFPASDHRPTLTAYLNQVLHVIPIELQSVVPPGHLEPNLSRQIRGRIFDLSRNLPPSRFNARYVCFHCDGNVSSVTPRCQGRFQMLSFRIPARVCLSQVFLQPGFLIHDLL